MLVRITSRRTTLAIGIALAVGMGVIALRSFGGSGQATGKVASVDAPVPVVVAVVEQRDIPVFRTGIGTVQAFNTVTVTSRVEGQIQEVLFREGQEVKAGDILARIDPRSFEATVREKQAQLRSTNSKLTAARTDLERIADLFRREIGTRLAFDNQRALVEQLEAQVDALAADVDRANLQLEYATIRSPIDGRTGFRQIDVGNVVRAGDRAVIVTVTQLQPISVVFTLPQEDLTLVTSRIAAGAPLQVTVTGRDGKLDLARGTLATIDNQIDAKTGTFKLKATFANEGKTLWPGEFVTARLLLTHTREAIVVPAPVVQRGPQGAYVFVIGDRSVAEMRRIAVAGIQDGLALIESGLDAGERVVTDGQFKLKNGSIVTITSYEKGTPPERRREFLQMPDRS